MKTRSLSILFAIVGTGLAKTTDSARLDRMENDISELSLMVRQLGAKIEAGYRGKARPAKPAPQQQGPSDYLVRTGDTFWGIARKHGIPVSALCALNPRMNPKRLQIGEYLKLPGAPATRTSARQQRGINTYEIRKGDTLGHIALAHKVPLKQLLAHNPGISPRKMQIGQTLQIPGQPSREDSFPESRPVDPPPAKDLEPLPEPPPAPELSPRAPEPEIPALTTEDMPAPTPEAPESNSPPPPPTFDLHEPEPTDLVLIDENSRLTEIAARYLTDVATLNKLNNVDLAPDQMIKSGSQLYIPRD